MDASISDVVSFESGGVDVGTSGLSDSLVQTAMHLEKQLTADKLDRHLHKRPGW